MYSRADIDQLARQIALAATSPAKVMLFGSYARGDATAGSDVDLLVLEKDIADKDDEYYRLFTAIRSANVDLILMREDDFLERRECVGSLPYRVAKEGVMVHGHYRTIESA